MGNWKKINKFSGDNNVIVLVPQLTINFADMQSSGRRSMFKKASVKAEDIIHFTSNNTCMFAFYSKAGAPSGELGATALEDSYHVPGKFAVNYLVDETDNATWVNSMTRLTGTSGNIHSSETWAVVANKNVFKQYTAAGGGVINSAFIELLKQ
ncbi:MAG: hypothetical protein NWQ04_09660 [Opitutales bacterium]|nr:hypothetical protein [Opitutales bacterium]